MTQEELGRRLQDTRTKGAVAHWEGNLTSPTIDGVRDIARVLDVDVTWLAFGIEANETIAVTGEIGVGGIVQISDTKERVPRPPGIAGDALNLRAYRVHTDAAPPLRMGDIVYVQADPIDDLSSAIGMDALVDLESGVTALRTIEISDQPGTVTLVDTRGIPQQRIRPLAVRLVVAIVRGTFAPGIKG